MRCCGWRARVVRGAICPQSLVAGTASSGASHGGPMQGYGKGCSASWRRTPILWKYFWTPRLCVPISTPAGRQKKGEQAIGRSRGGLSTKIHALVDGQGHLARFELTPGQAGDVTRAAALLDSVPAQAVLADTAYDAAHLIDPLHARGVKTVIPSNPTRKNPRQLDRDHYRKRNVIERWFARVKQFRRIATRYDKLASRFASFLCLCATFIWLT